MRKDITIEKLMLGGKKVNKTALENCLIFINKEILELCILI